MSDLTGQTLAGFEIVGKLGEGGMGAVYKARQPMLNRSVALKVMAGQLNADPAFIARFIREASSAANINHPNMVQVYTAGESDGIYYIAMEFIEGESLRKRMERHGRLPPDEAVTITIAVADALAHAWNKAKLIHRDIKPDNIFISNAGDVKLGDLGLAKIVDDAGPEMTQTGVLMGSPHYISPEQAQAEKDVDFRSDIYSLGCTLYHMLTGQTVYNGKSSIEILIKHIQDPIPSIFSRWPDCPKQLGCLVDKMIAKDRAERPQSYEELISQLHGILNPGPAVAPEKKRSKTIMIVAAAVALVLAGGILKHARLKKMATQAQIEKPNTAAPAAETATVHQAKADIDAKTHLPPPPGMAPRRLGLLAARNQALQDKNPRRFLFAPDVTSTNPPPPKEPATADSPPGRNTGADKTNQAAASEQKGPSVQTNLPRLTKDNFMTVLATLMDKRGKVSYECSGTNPLQLLDFPQDRRRFTDRSYKIPSLTFEPQKGKTLAATMYSKGRSLNVHIEGVSVVHLFWYVDVSPDDVPKVANIMQQKGWILLDQTSYNVKDGSGELKMVKICSDESITFPLPEYKTRLPSLIFSSPNSGSSPPEIVQK